MPYRGSLVGILKGEISLEISHGSSDWLVSPVLAPKPSERETTLDSEGRLYDLMSGEAGTVSEKGPGLSGQKVVLGSLGIFEGGSYLSESNACR